MEEKGKKSAGEQVKPAAGRSAGSYKFPGLLLGPDVGANVGRLWGGVNSIVIFSALLKGWR